MTSYWASELAQNCFLQVHVGGFLVFVPFPRQFRGARRGVCMYCTVGDWGLHLCTSHLRQSGRFTSSPDPTRDLMRAKFMARSLDNSNTDSFRTINHASCRKRRQPTVIPSCLEPSINDNRIVFTWCCASSIARHSSEAPHPGRRFSSTRPWYVCKRPVGNGQLVLAGPCSLITRLCKADWSGVLYLLVHLLHYSASLTCKAMYGIEPLLYTG